MKELSKSIALGCLFYVGFLLLGPHGWTKEAELQALMLLSSPYFLVWIVFKIVYFLKTGKVLVPIFYKSAMFDERLHEKPNIFWAISLLLVCVGIAVGQYYFTVG